MSSYCQLPNGTIGSIDPPGLLLPGSFNPLHVGHLELAQAAARRIGQTVHFELSIANVDKPDLEPEEVARRLKQFEHLSPIWVTRAPTFAQKAELFPGCCFVIGHDTATRLFDVKYYQHSSQACDAALRRLLDLGCRFIVGGRLDKLDQFQTWNLSNVPLEYRGMFLSLAEADFRQDISSTELRRKLQG